MELQDIKKEELIPVDVMFDNDGNPVAGFKCVGINSEEYQAVDREWRVRNVRKQARRGRQIEAATETGAKELVEQQTKKEFAICVGCIKEIYGFTVAGEPAPLNEATLKELFTKRPSWRTKVVNAVEAEQLFTQPS